MKHVKNQRHKLRLILLTLIRVKQVEFLIKYLLSINDISFIVSNLLQLNFWLKVSTQLHKLSKHFPILNDVIVSLLVLTNRSQHIEERWTSDQRLDSYIHITIYVLIC